MLFEGAEIADVHLTCPALLRCWATAYFACHDQLRRRIATYATALEALEQFLFAAGKTSRHAWDVSVLDVASPTIVDGASWRVDENIEGMAQTRKALGIATLVWMQFSRECSIGTTYLSYGCIWLNV